MRRLAKAALLPDISVSPDRQTMILLYQQKYVVCRPVCVRAYVRVRD